MEATQEELPFVDLMGLKVTAVTQDGCVHHIDSELGQQRGGWVITPNLDILRQAAGSHELMAMTDRATLRVADGMPLVWASRLQGTPLPGRVNGTNLMVGLCGAAAQSGRSVYFLGGDEGTAEAAAKVLSDRFEGLRVAGCYCPPVGFEKDEGEIERIREALAAAKPDIMFVGLGFPKQERTIERFRDGLPGAWWLGVGVSFSLVSGRVRRAPVWMQRCGLEWLHRMFQEPGRLFSRYILKDMPFAVRMFVAVLARRFQ